jgi:CRISPR-associated protein Cmr3
MKSLNWLYPSALAGSLRTMVGKRVDPGFGGDLPGRLKKIEVAGPLPCFKEQLFFPAPRDLAIRAKDWQVFAVRPRPMVEGCKSNLPAGLLPAMLPDSLAEDFKPAMPPAFWRTDRMDVWLSNPSGAKFGIPEPPKPPARRDAKDGYVDGFEQERRTHVQIEAATAAAKDERLFETVGLCFPEDVAVAARVDAGEFAGQLAKLRALHPLGGERRLAEWREVTGAEAWACPAKVRGALREAKKGSGIRMVMATPALFKGGWLPGWLDENLAGSPDGVSVKLKLVGACVDRWRPISGWSLEHGKRGPKAARRVVPAGSVYFFELESADAAALAGAWLKPVSDLKEDRRDGFGLALWGVWS